MLPENDTVVPRVSAGRPTARVGQTLAPLLARCDAGQSMVEMAFVLPVLLLVVTGILVFGLAFNNYLLLTEATGTAARAIAIGRGQTLDPCATVVAALYGAAPLLTPSQMTITTTIYTGPNSSTPYTGTSCSSSSTTTGAAGSLTQGQPVVVRVVYPCSMKVFRNNLVPSCNLTAQTAELVQ